MLLLPRLIRRNLSVRLSLMFVGAMSILLMASLIVMLHFSRKAVKEGALQKASQTLEGIVMRIDNILLSVEQTTGNIYFSLLPHLDHPDMMMDFTRQLVEANPYIDGCAIAFKPDFYADKSLFMTSVRRTDNGLEAIESSSVQTASNGSIPYTEQEWFAKPLASGKPGWMNPRNGENASTEPVATFCLPIPGADSLPVGVIGVDVSLSQLSQIMLKAKPSPHSYCTLLGGDGSYILHPDSMKLSYQTVFSVAERETHSSVKKAAEAIMSGQTGYMPFQMNGNDYLVFYKPFERTTVPGRSMEKLGWRAGIIYPEEDIFGDYNRLLYYVFAISFVGLLLLLVFCRTVTYRQLVPLRMLTRMTKRIAKGNYDETIPELHRHDEIGRLQSNFQQMQQTVSAKVSELDQLKTTLQERNHELHMAYQRAQKADRMKTAFLHNMTIQMVGPANAICMDVNIMCNNGDDAGDARVDSLTDDIQKKGEDITELLNNLIDMSQEK